MWACRRCVCSRGNRTAINAQGLGAAIEGATEDLSRRCRKRRNCARGHTLANPIALAWSPPPPGRSASVLSARLGAEARAISRRSSTWGRRHQSWRPVPAGLRIYPSAVAGRTLHGAARSQRGVLRRRRTPQPPGAPGLLECRREWDAGDVATGGRARRPTTGAVLQVGTGPGASDVGGVSRGRRRRRSRPAVRCWARCSPVFGPRSPPASPPRGRDCVLGGRARPARGANDACTGGHRLHRTAVLGRPAARPAPSTCVRRARRGPGAGGHPGERIGADRAPTCRAGTPSRVGGGPARRGHQRRIRSGSRSRCSLIVW